MLLPVCFYIGYFGAGAGFLMMTALALFGLEKMHELNSLKVVAAGVSNLMRGGDVYLQRSDPLALLPHLDGVCRSRRIRRSALCAQDEAEMLRTIVVVTGLIVAGYFFWKLR